MESSTKRTTVLRASINLSVGSMSLVTVLLKCSVARSDIDLARAPLDSLGEMLSCLV